MILFWTLWGPKLAAQYQQSHACMYARVRVYDVFWFLFREMYCNGSEYLFLCPTCGSWSEPPRPRRWAARRLRILVFGWWTTPFVAWTGYIVVVILQITNPQFWWGNTYISWFGSCVKSYFLTVKGWITCFCFLNPNLCSLKHSFSGLDLQFGWLNHHLLWLTR